MIDRFIDLFVEGEQKSNIICVGVCLFGDDFEISPQAPLKSMLRRRVLNGMDDLRGGQ